MVDDVGHHAEAPRGEVGPRGGRLVLVAHAHRPRQVRAVPELPAEQLVPREDVAEDLGVLVDEGHPPRVQPLHPPRLLEPVALPPRDRAGHEVGAAAQLAPHHVVRRRRHDVVAVGEGEQLARGHLGPGVAGGPEPVVVGVEDPDPVGVGGGVGVRDRPGGVGRAVVDDHDLEGGVGLREQAVEALAEVVLDVVGRHHDRQQRTGPTPETHVRTLAVRAGGPQADRVPSRECPA